MSAGHPISDVESSQRLHLDESSFQRLLEAAWVIQCQRDLELGESKKESGTVQTDVRPRVLTEIDPSILNADLVLPSANADGESYGDQTLLVDPVVTLGKSAVQLMRSQPEVTGSLALAADPECVTESDPFLFVPLKAGIEPLPNRSTGRPAYSRPTLTLVKLGREKKTVLRLKVIFAHLPSLSAVTFAGPILDIARRASYGGTGPLISKKLSSMPQLRMRMRVTRACRCPPRLSMRVTCRSRIPQLPPSWKT
jgi:hypothetical protein